MQTKNINTAFELYSAIVTLYETEGFTSEFILLKQLFSSRLQNAKYKNKVKNFLLEVKQILDDLSSKGLEIPKKIIVA